MENGYMNFEEMLSLPITVVGLGISNIPLLKFLLSSGAVSLSARDRQEKSKLSSEILALEKCGVKLICGEEYLKDLDEKIIFRSPGVRPDAPELSLAKKNGAFITSEMELFFSLCPAKILGITGSDGKTTTTTLTYELLKRQAEISGDFKVFVGGNIGAPLLPLVNEMTENDFAVLELSSFQLQDIRFSPSRAVITNITPNHLNWHKDYYEYIAAKKRILGKETHAVLNAQNEECAQIAKSITNKTVFSAKMTEEKMRSEFPTVAKLYKKGDYIIYWNKEKEIPVLKASEIKIPGIHNEENYMAAIALTAPYVNIDVVKEVAQSFNGVEHRLEFVRSFKGVKYYNSSIDSSPTRTAAALSALKEKPIVICGGAAKGIPFDSLAATLCEKAKAVVLTGQTASDIEKALNAYEKFKESNLAVIKSESFENAVLKARDAAKEGDTVLLSPACTSFDSFKNFEQRGKTYKNIVNGFKE